MTTTPPPEDPMTPPRTTTTPAWGSMPDAARLPIPGNAEFAVYVLSLIVAWLVVWPIDSLNASSWFTFFTVTTAVYILSRGIAKASRVLEQ